MKRLLAVSLVLLVSPAALAQEKAASEGAPAAAAHTPAPSAEDQLVRAYEKEFAFLQAQKAALEKRLVAEKTGAERKRKTAQADVDRLQKALLARTLRGDRAEDALRDAERMNTQWQDSAERFETVLGQAHRTLQDAQMEVPEVSADTDSVAVVTRMFGAADQLIQRNGSIHRGYGPYFAKDGTQVNGTIIHVGQVAAYGIGDETGALAPAGAGRLKVWHESTPQSAQSLAAGNTPAHLSMFLFESLDSPVEEKPHKSLLEFIDSGGVIAWVIVVLGFAGLVMIGIRAVIMMQAARRTGKMVEEIAPLVADGKTAEALRHCPAERGPTARVLAATIRNLDRDRQHLEDIVSEAVLHEAPHIERYGNAIMVVAAVAPLLGLLGTVTGMISTFNVITEYGTGDPKMLSGGISEALVTTELGLIVAIPTLLLGSLLSSRAQTILEGMERAALKIMNLTASRRMKLVPVPPPADRGPDADNAPARQVS